MKTKLNLFKLFAFILIVFLSSPVFSSGVQTTFTKSNNVITVKAKANLVSPAGSLTNVVSSFRYLALDGLTFTVTGIYYTPDQTTITDPVNTAYQITIFTWYGTLVNPFTVGSEISLFSVTVSGGYGTTPLSLVADSPDNLYSPYYELDNGTWDITDYTNIFYPGTDVLSITTVGNRIYATENLLLGKYWKTTGTTDWATGSNWSDNSAPTSGQNIAILAGGTQPTTVTGSICNNLKIESGAVVTIAPNTDFTVNGTLTNNTGAGGIVIQSTSSGTGSLIHSSTGVSATVQRYISGWGSGSAHGWHLLGSPVVSQAISPAFTDPTPANYDFYGWGEPQQLWLNYKAGSIGPNFIVGTGYLVAYAATSTKSFTGTLNTASVSVSGLTNTGSGSYTGFNLLSNPFSSALQWNDGNWALSNVDANCQIWNEANASYSVIGAKGIIPAMNGFMVHTSGNGSLTIPASARIHNSTPWYKDTQINNNRITLKAVDADGQTAQETIIEFNPDATSGYDPLYDSYFMSGYAPLFYSIINNENYALNSIPSLVYGNNIPLGFEKNNSTNFSIVLSQTTLNQAIYLTDLKLNYTQNLADNPIYSFTSLPGDAANRFLLSFTHVGIDETKDTKNDIYSYDNSVFVSATGLTKVEIYSLTGQQVFSQDINNINSFKTTLSVPSGYYIIRVTANANVTVKKVFINH